MKEIISIAGNLLGIGKGGKTTNGLVSVLKEKSGKISFRRSASIVVLTAIVAPEVLKNGLTWMSAIVLVACLIAPSININIGNKE